MNEGPACRKSGTQRTVDIIRRVPLFWSTGRRSRISECSAEEKNQRHDNAAQQRSSAASFTSALKIIITFLHGGLSELSLRP